MNKETLLKYAESGVRDRLQEIQLEINELARLFPHIVNHQDGSIPAVVPIMPKVKSKPNGKAGRVEAVRVPEAQRLATLRAFLTEVPGSNTHQIAAHLGVATSYANKLLLKIGAKSTRAGHRAPSTWRLGKRS